MTPEEIYKLTSKENQHKLIWQQLLKDGSMTPMDAWEKLKITKLATRVSEMIKLGYPIEKTMEYKVNSEGKKKRYMRYTVGAVQGWTT